MMSFEYQEDEQFFHDLLCEPGDNLDKYQSLFDFRSPSVKRNEFNRQRAHLLADLLSQDGCVCQLQYSARCNIERGLVIDHLIPLSSNKLNKELRHLSALPGNKVASQSFGSNHPNNLILACGNCNGLKKHRLLTREQIRPILRLKGL